MASRILSLSGRLALLQLDPDTLAQLGAVPAQVQPQHPDSPAVRGTQPFDNLHRGGLAGAVGPEDPEDLAALHGERQVVDRDLVAVPLVQVLDFDDRHLGPPPRSHRVHDQGCVGAG